MIPYDVADLSARVAEASEYHAAYVEERLEKYRARALARMSARAPVFAFCGYGRAGKDEGAEYLCARTGLVYPGSSSWIVLPVVARAAGVAEHEAWHDRHAHRDYWIRACHAFRGADYTRLTRMVLGWGDVVTGIRGKYELFAGKKEGVYDLSLWVENPRVPPDPTVEYGPEDCDAVVSNAGSLTAYYQKLDAFVRVCFPPREEIERKLWQGTPGPAPAVTTTTKRTPRASTASRRATSPSTSTRRTGRSS